MNYQAILSLHNFQFNLFIHPHMPSQILDYTIVIE